MPKYFWHRQSLAWIELDETAPRPRPVAPLVVKDIDPYRSMFTGERIRSRRHHRDHLRAHRLIEIGTEYDRGLPIDQAPESAAMTERGRRDAIERAYNQVSQGGGVSSRGTEGDLDG